jgi:acetyl esterase/lipase
VRTEANFLSEYDGVPDDLEVLPGLTVGLGKSLLRRPADDPAGARFVPSIIYSAAAGDVGQMALYARQDASDRSPIVVFVHGGGWNTGHHFGEIRYAHPLAALGYVTATVTYRLAGEGAWPAAIEDTKCAVRWLRHHAGEIGGDPDRIVICGGSAGGQLSALVALTPGEYEGEGGWAEVSSRVQAAVLLSPAVDLDLVLGQDPVSAMSGYFGRDVANASPLNRVHPAAPPILTLSGTDDVVTKPEGIRRFHAALAAAGVQERLELFEGGVHGFDILPAGFAWCLERIVEFASATVGLPVVEETTRG